MSELEHYLDDARSLDREVVRAALVCGVDLNDEALLHRIMHSPWHTGEPIQDRARDRLRGLLFLRDKLDTERLRDIAAGTRADRHLE